MTVKYEGNNEYNFQSSITDVTFTEILPLKTIDLFKDKQKIKELPIINAKPIIDFICSHCQNDKHGQASQVYINGLGVNPHQLQTICSDCLEKVDIIKPKAEF